MGIKVKAKQVGFYKGSRRRVGDVFVIQGEKQLSGWMERVQDEAPAVVTKEGPKKPLGLPAKDLV